MTTRVMMIHVTAEDIQNGLRKQCGLCPIALALRRAGFVNPLVSFDKVWVGHAHQHQGYLPLRAVRFIEQFDAGQAVKPFCFNLDLDLRGTHDLRSLLLETQQTFSDREAKEVGTAQ